MNNTVGIKKGMQCNYATKNYCVYYTRATQNYTLNYAIQIILQTNYLRTHQTQTK